jgi:DNA-binding NarL/FixJ family response regulator
MPANPKRSSLPVPHPVERHALPRQRPGLVFARDDTAGSGKQPAEPARIVIVEDDFLVAAQMEAALADAGFEVVGVAASADEALQLAVSQHPAVVVMDVRLDGPRDGIDAALELFRVHEIRCIFATAHHDPHARRRAKPAAPLGWLPKPYTMPSLVEMVRQALRQLDDKAR